MAKSMKPDEPGGDAASTTPAAGDQPATTPAAPAAAPAASSDALAAIQQQIADMQANHTKEVADLKNALSQRSVAMTPQELDTLVAERVKQAIGAVPPPPGYDTSVTQDQLMAKFLREQQEREDARNQTEKWLESGPQQFVVSHSNQPRATRTVGAASPEEAEAKYRRYYGITAIVDPTHRIGVEPIKK